MKDNINPNHYKVGGMEPWDYMKKTFSPTQLAGFALGNVIKYVSRAEYKNKSEDLKKSQWYLKNIIAEIGKYPTLAPISPISPVIEHELSWEYMEAKLPKDKLIGYAIGNIIDCIRQSGHLSYLPVLKEADFYLDKVVELSELPKVDNNDITEENDSWIEHDGTFIPLSETTLIDVKLRNGEIFNRIISRYICWLKSADEEYQDSDVVAYRISKEK